MSVIETIGTIRNGLMWIGLSALAAIVVCVVGVWLCRGVASAMRRPLAVVRLAAFVVVSAFCVIRGGAKFLMPPPSTGGTPVVPVVVTPEEIAQGWRLESVVTNDAVSYAMPTNGVEYAPWSLGGGYEMHFPLDLGDFAFPFGTGVVHRLDVLSGGMVESLPRQRVEGQYSSAMSICAAREYASIVPGVGRFWWADAVTAVAGRPPYRGKILTWENVYAGRDRTGQYNAQIELCGDGNFITRSNNVERIYRRVLPYDLDNDGLPNTIDPAPEVPLVPSVWNQSEAWAAAAFPSNAAEIAAMGGYAAWATARGAEPDRCLVSLGLVFDDGSVRPTLLDFGGVPVVADGTAELVFAIDCGARVPFSLTTGRLGSLAVTATEPPMRSGEDTTTTESSEFQGNYDYPHERTVNNVKVHLDGPRSGWLCRTAGVSVEPSWLPHFFPDDSVELTAEVSGCHSNAYLGCTWTGGAGITFSQEHSLSTEATYDPDDPDIWATNGIDLITCFVGYSLTNHVNVTVGVQVEPPLGFSLGCQEIFFLNDAELGSTSNRAERIRPVSLNLTGPLGTNGTARLSVQGNVNPVLFQVEDGVTNRVTESTVFSLAVADDFAHTGNNTVYMSCPNLGTGTITATFTPADGGEPLTDSVTFRCIEPLRKLVTTEKKDGNYVNPSRLVMGTNAVLKVGANGPFTPSEVNWHVVSGSVQLVRNGWYATVTPIGTDTVIVEARFNDDEIQPRFVLPVVQPRTISVKAFVVEPPTHLLERAWEDDTIMSHIDKANEIFSQIGVRFQLDGILHDVGTSNDWNLCIYEERNYDTKWETLRIEEYTEQFERFVNVYTNRDCVKVFYLGSVRHSTQSKSEDLFAEWKSEGIFIPKGMPVVSLAHELGHVLRLFDTYLDNWHSVFGEPARRVELAERKAPLERRFWGDTAQDWGRESGRGFYELNDTVEVTLRKFLMYGVYENLSDVGCDIPADTVWGLPANATGQGDARLIAIGARQTELHGNEVYSR